MCDTQNCYIEINTFEVGRRHKVYQKAISLGVQLWSSTHDTVVYWIQMQLGHKHGLLEKNLYVNCWIHSPIIEKRVREGG